MTTPTDFSALNSAHLLEEYFREFFYVLLKCKEIALRSSVLDDSLTSTNTPPPAEEKPEAKADGADEAEEPAANANQHPTEAMNIPPPPVHAVQALENIQERLKAVLTAQTNQVVHLLDQTDTLQFKDAQYAMVALADEIFLSLPWKGRALWSKRLLESQVFQSQSSGTTLFQKMDALLSRYDPSRKSLAVVYFNTLVLGFKGTYSEAENQSVIKNYEARLYAFVFGKNPSLAAYGVDKLAPDCYASTVQSEAQPGLPDVRFWAFVIGGIVLLLFLASYIIWYDTAADLQKSLNSIFDRFKIYITS